MKTLQTYFDIYINLINTTNDCGIYCSAVLLAYYQDHIDPSIIHTNIRKPHQTNLETLIQQLKKEITSFHPIGHSLLDLSMGINRFLRKYSTNNYKAHCILGPSKGILKAHLSFTPPRPIIISIISLLGSPKNYRNHFLLAHLINNNQLICYDNHGKSDAHINNRWTIGSVVLRKRK